MEHDPLPDLPHHRLENRGLKTRGLHQGKRPGTAQEGQEHHHDQTLMSFRPRTLALQKQQGGEGDRAGDRLWIWQKTTGREHQGDVAGSEDPRAARLKPPHLCPKLCIGWMGIKQEKHSWVGQAMRCEEGTMDGPSGAG